MSDAVTGAENIGTNPPVHLIGKEQMGLFTRGKGAIGDTDTLTEQLSDTETTTEEELESGDHERFSHYVRKEKIVESAVSGKPVVALCGKRWIPSRDPNRFPICPTCKEIHSGLRKGPDENSGNDTGNSN